MPSNRNERFISAANSAAESQTAVDVRCEPGEEAPFTNEQLERWAQLLADGELDFPPDLPAAQVEQLVALVQCRRRQRLIRWLASEIARHLQREDPSRNGDSESNDTL